MLRTLKSCSMRSTIPKCACSSVWSKLQLVNDNHSLEPTVGACVADKRATQIGIKPINHNELLANTFLRRDLTLESRFKLLKLA